jgi:glycosyltransferase involved in cell wall biosynthesis
MNKTLGGYVCIRNGFSLDYCWELAIASLLPVCDEVLLVDAESTDGTLEAAQLWAEKEPKLRVVQVPWDKPEGDKEWWIRFLNRGRAHLTTNYQITLDGDEVLSDHPDCHAAIREAVQDGRPRTFDRINFWGSVNTLIPEGHAIGKWVVRFGPREWHMPSDEGHPAGELPILDNAVRDGRLQIMHLGFLRREESFFRKAKVVLKAFFGKDGYDPRLARIEAEGKPLSQVQDVEWTSRLTPWSGYLPDAVQRWLSERGHRVPDYLPRLPETPEPRIPLVKPVSNEPVNVRICGDLGDILHAMATFKAIGKVNIYAVNRGICKALLPRLHLIKPLLESQSYIKSVQEHTDEPIHWDASDFRTQHRWTQSLTHSHLLHYRSQTHLPPISPDFRKPWLTGITADPRAKGRVLVHRTDRYNNDDFKWADVVKHYGHRLMLVGTAEERDRFCGAFGHVEYVPTADLLEVAQLVAGADLVIAGQSCVLAIAEAMKRPRIAEISASQPDVIVAISPEAQYVADGSMRLPDVAGSGVRYIAGGAIDLEGINTAVTPPGGWKHPVLGRYVTHFRVAVADVARMAQVPLSQAKTEILQHTVDQSPDFFTQPHKQNLLANVQMAVQNALR